MEACRTVGEGHGLDGGRFVDRPRPVVARGKGAAMLSRGCADQRVVHRATRYAQRSELETECSGVGFTEKHGGREVVNE